jgi:hypothetical protein
MVLSAHVERVGDIARKGEWIYQNGDITGRESYNWSFRSKEQAQNSRSRLLILGISLMLGEEAPRGMTRGGKRDKFRFA